ncbi:MAG TPA: Ig-like domain-containing protein [Gemmatimonadaceae bacterium]|jgi:uncharacterized protein YjdB
MNCTSRIATVSFLLVTACTSSKSTSLIACADTVTVVMPADTSVAVGASFVVSATEYTCQQRQRIDESFDWSTRNSDVAVVDQTTRVVTARGAGTTTITASPFTSSHEGSLTITVH